MQNINDEATRSGEEAKLTLKKLIKCLDKGREVPVQEAVFRACGLPLTKFSALVKFINTVHPERRDGLLKKTEEVTMHHCQGIEDGHGWWNKFS